MEKNKFHHFCAPLENFLCSLLKKILPTPMTKTSLIRFNCCYQLTQGLKHASRGPFVRPAMLFGNFLIINIYVAKSLEKRRHEIIESKLHDTQRGFCSGRSATDHISLSSKILRNPGSMLKTSSYALSTSRKHTTAFLVKSIEECTCVRC